MIMKIKMVKKFSAVLAGLLLALAGSCDLVLGPDEAVGGGVGSSGGSGNGNLVISVGKSGAGRAISSGADLPDDVLAALRYELVLTGPRGELLERTVTGGESFSLAVSLGEGRIDATAYQDRALAGTGSVTLAVGPGSNSAQVPMNMTGPCYEITIDPGVAYGTVRSNFTAAFAGTSITITAEEDPDLFFWDNLEAVERGTGNSVVSGSGTRHSFMMPAGDVEITAGFERLVRYVRAGGAGTKDGTSWANASDDLQKMMDESELPARLVGHPCIVKVGAGTYTPQYKPDGYSILYAPGDRDSAFILRRGVQVWGGYPASGGDRQNVTANVTTLSGNLNGTDNAYHVVVGAGIDSTTVLDGLTISGGNADGGGSINAGGENIERNMGGGIYNAGGSSPKLTNVTIFGNKANNGGGMYNAASTSPKLTNVTISNNEAANEGGGIYNNNSSSAMNGGAISTNTAHNNGGGIYNTGGDPVLINVNISGNRAISGGGQFLSGMNFTHFTGNGGGIYNSSGDPVLINVNISGNYAIDGGGNYGTVMNAKVVIGNGGGAFNNDGNPVLINVNISGNYAIDGGNDISGSINFEIHIGKAGGLFNTGGSASSKVQNSIIWGNTAADSSHPNIFTNGGTPTFAYSIVQGSGGSGGSWTFGSPTDDGNNKDEDPLFSANYHLNSGSPAINAGSNGLYSIIAGTTLPGDADAQAALLKDLGGNTRTQGGTIDMGAYERQ
jgi:hypothetical protein